MGLCGSEKSCSTASRIAPRTASAGPGNALSGTTSYHCADGGGLTRTRGRLGVVGLGGCGKDAAVLGLAARCETIHTKLTPNARRRAVRGRVSAQGWGGEGGGGSSHARTLH